MWGVIKKNLAELAELAELAVLLPIWQSNLLRDLSLFSPRHPLPDVVAEKPPGLGGTEDTVRSSGGRGGHGGAHRQGIATGRESVT